MARIRNPQIINIWTGNNEEEAFAVERHAITIYGRRDVNTGCLPFSTIREVSEAGRIVSGETRNKLARSFAGTRNHFFGHTHSAESRAKIGAAHKGKKLSPKQKKQISEQHTGRVDSAETRQKRSDALRGKKKSPEHIAKMSASKRGKRLSETHRAKLSAAMKDYFAGRHGQIATDDGIEP